MQLPDATEARPAVRSAESEVEVAHFKPGQVHYTTLEGIPEGAPVMAGTFSVNGYHVFYFQSQPNGTLLANECMRCPRVKQYGDGTIVYRKHTRHH